MGERHMKETAAGARTKQLLTDSLRHLMEKKPLNQISVKEITDGCGMQRQTFYYHFHDVYDQLKWAYQQQIAVLFSEHQEESWQESLLRLFHYVEKNRGICRSILESVGSGLYGTVSVLGLWKRSGKLGAGGNTKNA